MYIHTYIHSYLYIHTFLFIHTYIILYIDTYYTYNVHTDRGRGFSVDQLKGKLFSSTFWLDALVIFRAVTKVKLGTCENKEGPAYPHDSLGPTSQLGWWTGATGLCNGQWWWGRWEVGQTPPLTPPLGCVYPQSMVHACSTCNTIFTSSFILALKTYD